MEAEIAKIALDAANVPAVVVGCLPWKAGWPECSSWCLTIRSKRRSKCSATRSALASASSPVSELQRLCARGADQCVPTSRITIAATTRYRHNFAMPTNSVKIHSGSRSMPAAMVIGSPMSGAQLRSSDHFP